MPTFQQLAATRPPSLVLTPPSVAFWMAMAIVADAQGRHDLRDRSLAMAASITAERSAQSAQSVPKIR